MERSRSTSACARTRSRWSRSPRESPSRSAASTSATARAFRTGSLSLAAVRDHPLLAEPDVLQAPGGGEVALRPEAPSGIHVRGGASDQVAYLLDGIPVFSPYHAAGTSAPGIPTRSRGCTSRLRHPHRRRPTRSRAPSRRRLAHQNLLRPRERKRLARTARRHARGGRVRAACPLPQRPYRGGAGPRGRPGRRGRPLPANATRTRRRAIHAARFM